MQIQLNKWLGWIEETALCYGNYVGNGLAGKNNSDVFLELCVKNKVPIKFVDCFEFDRMTENDVMCLGAIKCFHPHHTVRWYLNIPFLHNHHKMLAKRIDALSSYPFLNHDYYEECEKAMLEQHWYEYNEDAVFQEIREARDSWILGDKTLTMKEIWCEDISKEIFNYLVETGAMRVEWPDVACVVASTNIEEVLNIVQTFLKEKESNKK